MSLSTKVSIAIILILKRLAFEANKLTNLIHKKKINQ